ncbi:MAG: rhodanese-like domain-containing protein [Candidatus Dependentiae bacterium]|nr:rhodanese-like domain-containing protein [Candidatus Dependentiae bacterium]
MVSINRFYSVFLLLVSALFLTGCWPFGSTQESVVETKKPELVIINVLDKSEFDDCHIKGSINIPFDEFESKIKSLNKNNHYVLYCADYMCMSSGFCANLLRNAKFEHVWAYEGGMAEWYQKGYPYQGPAELDYLRGENENVAEDEESDVPTISAEQLVEKIEQFASKE